MPPERVSPETVAVIVQGDSMAGLLGDGSVLYYETRREPPTDDLIGRLCIVGLADGRVLVKILQWGSAPGRYNLASTAMNTITDQIVEWAARVTFIGFP